MHTLDGKRLLNITCLIDCLMLRGICIYKTAKQSQHPLQHGTEVALRTPGVLPPNSTEVIDKINATLPLLTLSLMMLLVIHEVLENIYRNT